MVAAQLRRPGLLGDERLGFAAEINGRLDEARAALAGRATWAVELVRAVDRGAVPAQELSQDVLRQMLRHSDPALTAAITRSAANAAALARGSLIRPRLRQYLLQPLSV